MNAATNVVPARGLAGSEPRPLWGPTSDSRARYTIQLLSGEVVTLAPVERVSVDSSRLYIHVGSRLRRSILLSEVYYCGDSGVAPPGFS